jgi:hypothetical protein
VYHLSEPSSRAEFDTEVEDWGAKCYQAIVEFIDLPHVLTEEMLRDYLARFMEHLEVSFYLVKVYVVCADNNIARLTTGL